MREIVHIQAGQCGNQIGAKVSEQRSGVVYSRGVVLVVVVVVRGVLLP